MYWGGEPLKDIQLTALIDKAQPWPRCDPFVPTQLTSSYRSGACPLLPPMLNVASRNLPEKPTFERFARDVIC